MGCGGAGARKNAALVAMSCLTLINEGADTGRICESRGGARAPRAPRAEGRAGSGKATAVAPRPVGKGRGGSPGPEATAASDGHGKGSRSPAPAGQRDRESAPGPEQGARAGSPPAHTRLLPASQGLCPRSRARAGSRRNDTAHGTRPPGPVRASPHTRPGGRPRLSGGPSVAMETSAALRLTNGQHTGWCLWFLFFFF